MGTPIVFGPIAHTYDLLNRIISFGQDKRWRKKVATRFSGNTGLRILDVATGTGDQVFAFLQERIVITRAVGLDVSQDMLTLARKKFARAGLDVSVHWQKADALALPFSDATFDVVTMSFAIRNMPDIVATLREAYRVLRPCGRLVVLELSTPDKTLPRLGHYLYCRFAMPLIGGLLSGQFGAYRYLTKSVERFPHHRIFCSLLRTIGFLDVSAKALSFGAARIYEGRVPVHGPGLARTVAVCH